MNAFSLFIENFSGVAVVVEVGVEVGSVVALGCVEGVTGVQAASVAKRVQANNSIDIILFIIIPF